MARTARQIGGYPEAEALDIVFTSAYCWLQTHGYPCPTLVDVSIRLTEAAYDQGKTLRKAVFSWMQSDDLFSPEGERRHRVTVRAFNRVQKMYGGN
jgi:hypothetical protein